MNHNEADLDVVYEDNHLLVVNKPASTPSQPDDSGDPALDEIAKQWLRRKYNKPGNVYLGLVHRLDRPTSGLVILAKTDKAASRMAEQFRVRAVEKTYYAVIETASALADHGDADDMLVAANSGGMAVVAGQASRHGSGSGASSGKPRRASLSWQVVGRAGEGRALLSVRLHTGVKHQIRCQLAFRGSPVVGDFRYGPRGAVARPEPVWGGRGILLHAGQVAFEHPVKKIRIALSTPPPGFWRPDVEAFSSLPVDLFS